MAEGDVGKELLPDDILEMYEVHERRHACSILASDFPEEYAEIVNVLRAFRLRKSEITTPGGSKSPVANAIDCKFYELGWVEKAFDSTIKIDGAAHENPTHKIDCYKNRIALEVEWNNKDPFYDRDLSNFRILFELRAISVGVMITRSDELQDIFKKLNKGSSYGASTTHMNKLLPRLEGGGAGGCPVLVFGITKNCYVEN